MSHQRIQLRDRVHDLGAHAGIGLRSERDLGHDALGGKMLEQCLTALEPRQMSAQARDDPHAALGDLTTQLRPQRPGAGCPKNVPRGPSVAGSVIGVARQGLPFAGQSRKLARIL